METSSLKQPKTDIVLVDDNELYLEVAKDLLERMLQRTVHIASTPYEAREILHSLIGPAIFLVDYHMPKIKGIELVKELREAAQFPIECVLVTAETGHEVHSAAYRAGIYPFSKLLSEKGKKFSLGEMYLSMVEFAEARLKTAVKQMTDSITGFYTWEGGEFMWPQTWGRAKRDKVSLALAFVDINDFKAINDTFTHGGGDKVLKAMGTVIRQHLRTVDAVRRRGDEIYILMEIEDTQDADRQAEETRVHQIAADVMERVNASLQELTVEVLPGVRVVPSVSIGVAVLLRENMSENPPHDFADLAKKAEVRMYEDKVRHYKKLAEEGNKPALKKYKYYLRVAAQKAAALK